jgi:hypothetical protein
VRTYPVAGGRVVFAVYAESCELVSAIPASDWRMESWKRPDWIRVDFVSGGRRTSVICSWQDHPPVVETDEDAT